MNRTFFLLTVCMCASLIGTRSSSAQTIVTFEGLLPGPGTFYNGDTGIGTNSNGWSADGVFFDNTFTDFGGGFTGWEGWSYSNVVDDTTAGFGNQYASFAGGGSDNAATPNEVAGESYAVAFMGSNTDAGGTPSTNSFLNLPNLASLDSVDVTNATYTGLYMQTGASPPFASVPPFTDGDFYRLFINGFDGDGGTGNATGSLTIDLANYGGAGTADDVLLEDWMNLDLSGFGLTKSLTFSATSSQINPFAPGLFASDVPAYVAIDNLTFTAVPEPSAFSILLMGLGAGVLRRRRR